MQQAHRNPTTKSRLVHFSWHDVTGSARSRYWYNWESKQANRNRESVSYYVHLPNPHPEQVRWDHLWTTCPLYHFTYISNAYREDVHVFGTFPSPCYSLTSNYGESNRLILPLSRSHTFVSSLGHNVWVVRKFQKFPSIFHTYLVSCEQASHVPTPFTSVSKLAHGLPQSASRSSRLTPTTN